ncbi:MAG: hypothetical protein ACK515_25835 [bacterium]|jgi:tripartite-type tricarboxylate transporter receptor subunit TctC|nr:hypothetical protein [Betaproteobacteria bacterium]
MAVVNGEIDFALITVAATMPHVKSGRLRALATSASQRQEGGPGQSSSCIVFHVASPDRAEAAIARFASGSHG